jgi:hypothetical protein
VRIYALGDDGTSWERMGEDIVGDMAEDLLGYAVSLLSNGTIVAIGAPRAGVNKVWSGQVKQQSLGLPQMTQWKQCSLC